MFAPANSAVPPEAYNFTAVLPAEKLSVMRLNIINSLLKLQFSRANSPLLGALSSYYLTNFVKHTSGMTVNRI